MKLSNFKQFNNIAINESYIPDEKFIVIEGIDSEEKLNEYVMEKVTQSFVDFCERFDVPLKNPKFSISKKGHEHYLNMTCDPCDKSMFGIFENTMEKVSFYFFGGKQILSRTIENAFKIYPHIWTDLNLSWEMISGGSNGGKYCYQYGHANEMLSKRSDLFYNLVTREWESYGEHYAKEIGELDASARIHKTNKNVGVFDFKQ